MSSVPLKTGIPAIIDSNLTTSVDFHVAFTNYSSILQSYINFLALSKHYDSIKYEADPITAEADFWEGIATSNLNLQQFAKNPKTTKYIKKIEIEVPKGDTLKIDDNGNPILIIKNTQLTATTVQGKEIPTTKDTTADVNKQMDKISSGFDLAASDKSGEFVAWWLDKFRKAHREVKTVLSKRLNIEDTILQTTSESVGLLFNQYLLPQRRYTHYADELFTLPGQDPVSLFPYNSIIDDKLEIDTRKNMLELSKRAEAIFGRNMQQVINSGSTAKDAHGENLVTDHFHYERLGAVHENIMTEIGRILGGSYKLLYWLTGNKIANKQFAAPGVYTVVVENSIQDVDNLMREIETPVRKFTMDSIKA